MVADPGFDRVFLPLGQRSLATDVGTVAEFDSRHVRQDEVQFLRVPGTRHRRIVAVLEQGRVVAGRPGRRRRRIVAFQVLGDRLCLLGSIGVVQLVRGCHQGRATGDLASRGGVTRLVPRTPRRPLQHQIRLPRGRVTVVFFLVDLTGRELLVEPRHVRVVGGVDEAGVRDPLALAVGLVVGGDDLVQVLTGVQVGIRFQDRRHVHVVVPDQPQVAVLLRPEIGQGTGVDCGPFPRLGVDPQRGQVRGRVGVKPTVIATDHNRLPGLAGLGTVRDLEPGIVDRLRHRVVPDRVVDLLVVEELVTTGVGGVVEVVQELHVGLGGGVVVIEGEFGGGEQGLGQDGELEREHLVEGIDHLQTGVLDLLFGEAVLGLLGELRLGVIQGVDDLLLQEEFPQLLLGHPLWHRRQERLVLSLGLGVPGLVTSGHFFFDQVVEVEGFVGPHDRRRRHDAGPAKDLLSCLTDLLGKPLFRLSHLLQLGGDGGLAQGAVVAKPADRVPIAFQGALEAAGDGGLGFTPEHRAEVEQVGEGGQHPRVGLDEVAEVGHAPTGFVVVLEREVTGSHREWADPGNPALGQTRDVEGQPDEVGEGGVLLLVLLRHPFQGAGVGGHQGGVLQGLGGIEAAGPADPVVEADDPVQDRVGPRLVPGEEDAGGVRFGQPLRLGGRLLPVAGDPVGPRAHVGVAGVEGAQRRFHLGGALSGAGL